MMAHQLAFYFRENGMRRIAHFAAGVVVLLVMACCSKNNDPKPAAGEIKVVSALWGFPGTPVDVTPQVQKKFEVGELVQANNGPLNMQADPAPGQKKVLEVVLQVNEKSLTLRIPEDGYMSLR